MSNNRYSDGRSTRSSHYQDKFLEIICPTEILEAFSTEDSISSRLNPFEYNEELKDLEDDLKKEFWRVVNTLLTDRQKEVIRLYADGYTQMEIATKLNVNQSSITKSLNGNTDYKNKKKTYGGAKRKLKKIIESDEKIKNILDKIKEIRENKW